MCRKEINYFACGHSEAGDLLFCPANQHRMSSHKFSRIEALKNTSVCFTCDIPNMKALGGRDSRREQLAALAQKEKDEGKAKTAAKHVSPKLLEIARKMEELKLVDGRQWWLDSKHLRESKDVFELSSSIMGEVIDPAAWMKKIEGEIEGNSEASMTMEPFTREDGWI